MKLQKIGLIALALLVLVPVGLMARGATEGSQPYGLLLEEEFTGLIAAVEAGEITLEEAIEQVRTFRQENQREENQDYQAMEQILEQVMTKTMTATQAGEQFYVLEESSQEMTATQLRQREQTMTQLKTGDGTTATQAGAGNAGGANSARPSDSGSSDSSPTGTSGPRGN